jgi:hypothetical protein
MDNLAQQFDKIINDWLKSGNENTTYCAFLLVEQIKKNVNAMGIKSDSMCYRCGKEKSYNYKYGEFEQCDCDKRTCKYYGVMDKKGFYRNCKKYDEKKDCLNCDFFG